MSTVVIVPGLHDSGPQHWQSRWQRQLPNSLRVEQTHWDVPDLKRWSGNVLQVLNDLDRRGEDCWIVAHSFGCLASVFALEQAFKAGALSNVRGIFLVAPADPQKFGVADMLPARPLQVAGGLSEGHRQISGRRIAGRRIAGRRIAGRMIASRSDPWLSWAQAEQWARRWALPIIDAGDAGHINAESGHGYWPEGWREFQQLRDADRSATPRRYLALAV